MAEAQWPVDSYYTEARDDLHLGCNVAYYGWQNSPVKCQMFQLWQLLISESNKKWAQMRMLSKLWSALQQCAYKGAHSALLLLGNQG